MINFMVLGGPRSGTTWAANWLTTDTTMCLHDPLLEYTTDRLARLTYPGRRLGIACTSSLLYPDWVNAQKCPKVLLYRNAADINVSLRQLGLVELIESRHLKRFDNIKGALMMPYEALFRPKTAEQIAKHLGVAWDPDRHYQLYQMRVEVMWRHVAIGKEAAAELVKRIIEAR